MRLVRSGMTYYWNVTAVNPAGSAPSTTVKSFTTAATYDLDFAGKGYVPWRTFGGASFTRGDIAVLKFAGATGGIRTGADYAPARINLSDMDRIQVTFAEGTDPSAIEALTISYRLQSENRETPVRTISAPVADAVDGVLTIDMTGMPGWGPAAPPAEQRPVPLRGTARRPSPPARTRAGGRVPDGLQLRDPVQQPHGARRPAAELHPRPRRRRALRAAAGRVRRRVRRRRPVALHV